MLPASRLEAIHSAIEVLRRRHRGLRQPTWAVMRQVLRREGIALVRVPLPAAGGRGRVITALGDSVIAIDRRITSSHELLEIAAHELGHVVLGHVIASGERSPTHADPREIEARLFAELLVRGLSDGPVAHDIAASKKRNETLV